MQTISVNDLMNVVGGYEPESATNPKRPKSNSELKKVSQYAKDTCSSGTVSSTSYKKTETKQGSGSLTAKVKKFFSGSASGSGSSSTTTEITVNCK